MPRDSLCWKFMSLQSPKLAVCDICKKFLAYSGATTNLNRHLQAKHAIEWFQAKEKRYPRRLVKETDTAQTSSSSADISTADTCTPKIDAPVTSTHSEPCSSTASFKINKTVQPTIDEEILKNQPFAPTHPRKRLIDNLILDMVITDMQPLSFVEN